MSEKSAGRVSLLAVVRLLRYGGVDRAVGFAVLGRGWSVVSGGLTLLMLTHFLNPVQQGYYYTFAGILGMQIFFELGIGYVILQFASHERAKLDWTPQGTLSGDPDALARLSSLFRLSLSWYRVVALLFLATILPVGFVFFSRHSGPGAPVAWQMSWLWVVLVTAATLAVSPVFAVLEGCGLVAEVNSVTAGQNILSSFVLWAALLLHCGLFVIPLGGLSALLFGLSWLWRRKQVLLRSLSAPETQLPGKVRVQIHWRTEIWPFQWKIAVSWLSGYFIFQIFTPLLFAFHGAVAAGRMGLSMTVMNAIASVAISWVSTKSAPFGSLVALRDFRRMDQLFFSSLWRSLGVVAVGGALFWLGTWSLDLMHLPLGLRLLAPLPLALLVGTSIINHIVFSEAIYLRAHKDEPFLLLSVIVASLIGSSAYFLGRPYGALGMTAGSFATTFLVALGGGTWLFLKKRHLWHQPIQTPQNST